MTTCRHRRMGTLLLALLWIGCVALQAGEQVIDPGEVVLHVDYRSGGDSPIGFLMTFLRDGRVRYYSPSRRAHWTELQPEDFSRLMELIVSPQFNGDLDLLRGASEAFACCDSHEVGIFVGATATPVAVTFDEQPITPCSVQMLMILINRYGDQYFGRHYRIELPVNQAS